MVNLDSRLHMSSYTPNYMYTKAHTFVCGKPTLKDVECLRNRSNLIRDHELYKWTGLSEPSLVKYAISNELSAELSNISLKRINKHHRVSIRDCEPSRLPIRAMERLKNKTRKVRMFVCEGIRLTIPKSCKLYCYVKARKQENKVQYTFTLECSEKLNHCKYYNVST